MNKEVDARKDIEFAFQVASINLSIKREGIKRITTKK